MQIAFTFFKEICRLQEVIQNQDSQIKSQEEGLKKLEPLKRTNQQQLINDKIQENTKLQLQVKESAEKINSLNYELGKTQKELEKMKKQKEENEQFYQAQLYSLKESNVPVEGGDTNALLSQMKQVHQSCGRLLIVVSFPTTPFHSPRPAPPKQSTLALLSG